MIDSKEQMRLIVKQKMDETPILDVHTHVFTPCFGDILLYGIDELLTYHYLVAETFRYVDMSYESFWAMTKKEQADLIYDTLFVRHTPISEACRGVLTVIKKMGAPVGRDLDAIRSYLSGMSREEYINKIFELSGVRQVIMTNDPFVDEEETVWLNGYEKDDRFLAALRLDGLLVSYRNNVERLNARGYHVRAELDEDSYAEIRRFLSDWVERMDVVYMAASLPDTFRFPDDTDGARIIEHCIIPIARKYHIPFAMMIGVKKLINPGIQLAGDGVGKADINAVITLCAQYPDVKFLCTMLSRENQHELAVTARKFRNLMIFGCWWFLNNPSIIEEMTRERLELLGTSMIPQHSDARVLDQLVYKWTHSRQVIGKVLEDKYSDLMATGWQLTEQEIERDVRLLLGGYLQEFLELEL